MTDGTELRRQRDAELVEHVGEDGSVIEVVTRAEMRARRLRHRCTYVVVIDSHDRVVVHRRAEWKDVYPGWWDLAFGGVCGVGEPWLESARRELAEEAGLIVGELIDLGPVEYGDENGSLLGWCYLALTDDEPVCDDGEVVEIGRVPRRDLADWADGRQVCLDSCSVVLPLVTAWSA